MIIRLVARRSRTARSARELLPVAEGFAVRVHETVTSGPHTADGVVETLRLVGSGQLRGADAQCRLNCAEVILDGLLRGGGRRPAEIPSPSWGDIRRGMYGAVA